MSSIDSFVLDVIDYWELPPCSILCTLTTAIYNYDASTWIREEETYSTVHPSNIIQIPHRYVRCVQYVRHFLKFFQGWFSDFKLPLCNTQNGDCVLFKSPRGDLFDAFWKGTTPTEKINIFGADSPGGQYSTNFYSCIVTAALQGSHTALPYIFIIAFITFLLAFASTFSILSRKVLPKLTSPCPPPPPYQHFRFLLARRPFPLRTALRPRPWKAKGRQIMCGDTIDRLADFIDRESTINRSTYINIEKYRRMYRPEVKQICVW